jgi:cell division protein FtsB
MGALTLVPSTGLPPARAALVNLSRRIADAESQLERLTRGRDQLRAELSRADTAKNELDSLISEDASSLVGKLRSGASWALAHFGSARAQNLVAALSESQVQLGVAAKALTSIEAEIAVAEREGADLKARKPDMVRAVLIEAAGGFRYDLQTALDHVRESLVILAALDRLTARTDGSYQPNERIVIEVPPLGGLPATAILVPEASIAAAKNVWAKYQQTIGEQPLASADSLAFPVVNPNADDGMISYDRLTATERKAVDQSRASGV